MNIKDIKIGDHVLFKRSIDDGLLVTVTYTLEKVERILEIVSPTYAGEKTFILLEGTDIIASLRDIEDVSMAEKLEKVSEKEYKYCYLWD